MAHLTGGKILGFLSFALLAFGWHLVHRYFGQTEGFRCWGLALLVVSVVLTVRDRIPVRLGNRDIGPLAGWRKAYVLVPTYAIGALVSLFPHEVACTVNLKGYLC